MTFLPIVERELRVSARSKATRRMRMLFALGAAGIAAALGTLSLAGGGIFGSQLGIVIFSVLKWAGFVLASGAGIFLTADCLSEEKREGTLGLLFLTDLRGYDVVLGKLLATSLRCFYGLLAIFPVMAFSFMLGGVAVDDFWHTIVSLCDVLFFSLALGMAVSVVSRDGQKAMTTSLAAMVLFLFVTPLLDSFLLRRMGNHPAIGLLSPLFSIVNTSNYRARDFWMSVLALQAAGWLFLLTASLLAPLTWHDRAIRGKLSQGLWMNLLRPWLAPPPKRTLLDQSPVAWIVLRDRWAPNLARLSILLVFGLLVLSVVSHAWGPVVSAAATPAFMSSSTTYSTTNATVSNKSYSFTVGSGALTGSSGFQFAVWCAGFFPLLLEFWLAVHVVRFYVEGRRNGFLESVLVTPTTRAEVMTGHWLGLRRLFFAPVAAQLVLTLVVGTITIWDDLSTASPSTTSPTSWWTPNRLAALQAGISLVVQNLTWIIGLFSLAWMAIWMGLSSRKTTTALVKSICYSKILPWFGVWFAFGLFFAAIAAGGFFGGISSGPLGGTFFVLFFQTTPSLIMMVVSLLLIRLARSRAEAAFKSLE